ncbi:hypothetical protein [Sinosporangium siamense]|uniref:Uncharacterized protein n=1 Tax=Sinosporangium siamense TaxID=1367973 RepID=A0A919RN66_9ACTN|nr:hypothetical protein [Sinosporangium siamense]GII96623.1 hypothetical protein Ssi02_68540 [Sinosporangium siamense]
MHGTYDVKQMPRVVRIARKLLWVEFALATVALIMFGFIFGELSARPDGLEDGVYGGAMTVIIASGVYAAILLAAAVACHVSRKRWVRIAILIFHGLLLLVQGIGLLDSVNIGDLARVVLLAAVGVCLFHPEAREWFDRR